MSVTERAHPGGGHRSKAARPLRYLTALAVAIATPATLIPSTAEAAVTQIPVLPQNIVVFPERDFLVLEGYAAGTPVSVEVVREGVVIGTAQVTTAAGDPSAEINHPGGACWLGSTPDIRPGDVVRAVESTDAAGAQTGQGSSVINVAAEQAVIEGTDVVVRGTARDASGNPIPLDLLEQRIINPDFDTTVIGRRDIRATSDGGERGTLAYDAPGSVHWTARYSGLSAQVRALALEGQTRIMSWLQTAPDGERAGLTIYEVGEAAGPGMPECPPLSEYAVTSTQPDVVGIETADTDLVVSGASYKATNVDVTLTDGNPAHPVLTASTQPSGDFQSWSVTFDHDAVGALDDGQLQIDARYTLAGGTIGGRGLTVLKDMVAPAAAPVAAPAGGTYAGAQSVKLTAEPGATIHYTLDGSTPDRRDPVYKGVVQVTADVTLKAIAYDAARNPSPVATQTYVITGARSGDVAAAGPATPDAPAAPRNVSSPPRIPQNVVVFPERDFVTAEGYEANAGQDLTFRVLRGGVEVGRAVAVAGAGDPSAEVNHPGGACWIGTTPDLKAGDVVEILTDTTPGSEQGDSTPVQNVQAQAAIAPNGPAGGTVVVTGTAMGPGGVRIPIANLEQRIINPDLTLTSNGRRDLRATSDGAGQGILAYDTTNPADGRWTATYTGLAADVVEAAIAGQTRIMAWQATDGAERAGITIYEVGEVNGPGMGGCPQAAPNAVTSSTPSAVSAGFVNSGQDLSIHGVTDGAVPSSVTLSDGVTSVPAQVQAGAAEGVWTATVGSAALASLLDGDLVATAAFAGGPGKSLTIKKDTVLPLAPVATPASGVWQIDQWVALSSPNKDDVRIHYTVDNEAAGPDDAVFDGQFLVSQDTTLRAVAVDSVGNVSPEAAYVYAIRVSTPDVPVGLALATASDSGAVGDRLTNDTTPTVVGTATDGLVVELHVDGAKVAEATVANGSFAVTPATALTNGEHTFQVRTRDSGGRLSALSDALVVRIDSVVPVVTITGGPTGVTNDSTPTFTFSVSEPAAAQCSPAGLVAGYAPCTSPVEYGPLSDGAYTFRVRATDAAGNVAVERTRALTVDTAAVPAPTPATSLLATGQIQATTVPVRVSWPAVASTDLARYELYTVAENGTQSPVALTSPTATTANVPLAPGKWSFRVVTVDRAGNTASTTGAPFVLSAAQDDSAAIAYSPTPTATRWRSEAVVGAFGGTVRHDSTAGATATYRFTGTQVQWITTFGANRGRADVFLDGVRVAAGVELHATATSTRRIAFSRSGLTAGEHTLQIRVTGTKLGKSKGTRVDVDAFVSIG